MNKDFDHPACIITAGKELFDFLKEKGEKKKTRLEAFCEIMEKCQRQYVSPAIPGNSERCEASQCAVTVTELAESWKWHRETVRIFLRHLEEMGIISMEHFSKYFIMTLRASGMSDTPVTSDMSGTTDSKEACPEKRLTSGEPSLFGDCQ